ncbi:MAG: hypothetical protein R3F23_00370 [Verrucomicrobiia bacterium]
MKKIKLLNQNKLKSILTIVSLCLTLNHSFSAGLGFTATGDEFYRTGDGVPGAAKKDDLLGFSMTSGDFLDSSTAGHDLAVGSPGKSISINGKNYDKMGSVFLHFNNPSYTAPDYNLTENMLTPLIPGGTHGAVSGSQFGFSLARMNNKLIVGIPYKTYFSGNNPYVFNAGEAAIVSFSSDGKPNINTRFCVQSTSNASSKQLNNAFLVIVV